MKNPRLRGLTALLLPLLVGCAERHPEGISDDTFVETMVELRRAAVEPESFPASRDRILRENNVTDAQLRAYIQSHMNDLEHIATVWERVNDQVSVAPPQ